ncbi:MAG: type IV secretion system DNA-binding domain-containing protein [Nitrospirae bacterium]|nr:type IV secretion system DNA-binding domain-containing protein [Nitrospirota bacterium]
MSSQNTATTGFESKFTWLKMTAKRVLVTFIMLALIQVSVWIGLCFFKVTGEEIYYTLKHYQGLVLSGLPLLHGAEVPMSIRSQGRVYTRKAVDVAHLTDQVAEEAVHDIGRFLFFSLLVYPVVGFAAHRYYVRAGKKLTEEKHVRGCKLVSEEELIKEMRTRKEKTYISIGNLKMPVRAENKHVFVVGRPGSGKGVCLLKVVDAVTKRGDRGIIYDYKGDYVKRFYDPKRDIIFNPLDSRCIGWSVLTDVLTVMGPDTVANSLIPIVESEDANHKFFATAARHIFAAILYCLKKQGKTRNADIWEMLIAEKQVIGEALKSTPGCEMGATYYEESESKSYPDIKNTLMQYVTPFKYMQNIDGGFSLKEWVEKGAGWIFVTNREQEKDTLRPILSLMIDLLARFMLDLPDDLDRRVFFFLDEFATLQKLPSIVLLLTGARSRGASVWLAIQDVGAITNCYGVNTRQTIINSLVNKIIFTVSEPETAEYLSSLISSADITKSDEGQSWGPALMRDGINVSRRDSEKRLVTPGELMALKELTAYVRFADYDITKTVLPNTDGIPTDIYFTIADPFILRPELTQF